MILKNVIRTHVVNLDIPSEDLKKKKHFTFYYKR